MSTETDSGTDGASETGRAPDRDTAADPAARREDHRRNTGLLDAELPDRRFVDERYLEWLYDANPLGRAFTHSVDDDGVRVAHYALVPQRYRDRHGDVPFVFSLNAVARSGNQRKGYFGGRAQAAGVRVVVGVCNEKSTWAVHKYGWRVTGPMPVRMVVPSPLPPRDVIHHRVTPELLDSPTFADLAEGLDESPAWHWTNRWTPRQLRWRLASPNGGGFTVHESPELVGVSTVDHRAGVPVAVVVKLLPRNGRFGPISARGLISAICHHHRAPAALYAGHNRHVVVRGIPLPERLKPVPLNLCVLSLDDRIDQTTFQFDTYELLDMDAY
jgi:hypothetical protein